MSDQATVISIKGGAVAPEVAEHEFYRFMEAMDLDSDTSRMDRDELRKFEANKDVVVRAIESGLLSIDNNGQPEYVPKLGDTNKIVFYEPSGETFLAMDSKRKDADMAKAYALLASLTKQPEVRFAKMKNRDLKICNAVAALFF